MSWEYRIVYMDGVQETIVSRRMRHMQPSDLNLIIDVNPHGHDNRFDEICIPLVNVRRYDMVEVQ